MKKNYKSVACPECKSSDINIKVVYQNEIEKSFLYADEVEAIEFSKEKVMQCHCKICNKEYFVNQGKDSYTLLSEPYPLTCSGDVRLLSIYSSEFDRDFKIIKMSLHTGQPITMALVENDKYPIIIPEEKDMEKQPQKIKSLIFNTWMNRHR